MDERLPWVSAFRACFMLTTARTPLKPSDTTPILPTSFLGPWHPSPQLFISRWKIGMLYVLNWPESCSEVLPGPPCSRASLELQRQMGPHRNISPQLSDSTCCSCSQPEQWSFSVQPSTGQAAAPLRTAFPSLPLQGYLLRGDEVMVTTEMKLRWVEENACEEHAFVTEIHLAKK